MFARVSSLPCGRAVRSSGRTAAWRPFVGLRTHVSTFGAAPGRASAWVVASLAAGAATGSWLLLSAAETKPSSEPATRQQQSRPQEQVTVTLAVEPEAPVVLHVANKYRRFFAYLIDAVVYSGFIWVRLLLPPMGAEVVAMLLTLCKDIIYGARSYGKNVMDLYIADATFGEEASTAQKVLRNIFNPMVAASLSYIPFQMAGLVSTLLVTANVFSMLLNDHNQTLADMISGTVIVTEPPPPHRKRD